MIECHHRPPGLIACVNREAGFSTKQGDVLFQQPCLARLPRGQIADDGNRIPILTGAFQTSHVNAASAPRRAASAQRDKAI